MTRVEKERLEEKRRTGDTDTHTWQRFTSLRAKEIATIMDMVTVLPLRFGTFEQVMAF